MRRRRITSYFLCLVPFAVMIWVWLSPLAFVPVPWPDDAAFYFVAKDFFQWPPKWVMMPQAPFEPTYRVFNFNTMPLYPILIGLGRWVGIDGSFAMKIWPLSFWAISGALLIFVLLRKGLPFVPTLFVTLLVSFDPTLRWASVLVRPESFVGLCGMALVLGLTFGFPERLKERGIWDPVAFLLATAAYAHFNAIHLLFPTLICFASQPLRLLKIGMRCTLYLSPWLVTVMIHPRLFVHQMKTQWQRLSVPNDWLGHWRKALFSVFQNLGSPEPWPTSLQWAAIAFWILLITALLTGVILPLLKYLFVHESMERAEEVPSAVWLLGAIWMWNDKPEVWFVYYVHLSLWCFTGIASLRAYRNTSTRIIPGLLAILLPFTSILFCSVTHVQARNLSASYSWKWDTYYSLVDCVSKELQGLQKRLGNPRTLQIWGPTFPDVTIELSRKHPDWQFTRTNDFRERNGLAIRHGKDVDAVVVTETVGWAERNISGPASKYPEIISSWMTWKDYYLVQLWEDPHWKPHRYICQRGRWQAFLFMKQ